MNTRPLVTPLRFLRKPAVYGHFLNFRESYYLTWKDMSTQMGIINVISSTKLWTAPSKEQYLPIYFKTICDEYSKSPNAHRMFPVKVTVNYLKMLYLSTMQTLLDHSFKKLYSLIAE